MGLDLKWSRAEKEAARRAFDTAYERECASIRGKLKEMIDASATPEDLWKIHDYLTKQRNQTDEKYDYRYSVLPHVFARLLLDGWLTGSDLDGLSDDKIGVINYLTGFGSE
jgi:hypothetical protein